MKPIIAFSNLKGGSGKTTSVVALAGAFASKGFSVLVVDLHPLAQASAWLHVHEGIRGAFSVLYEGVPLSECVRRSPFDRIDVVRPGILPFASELRPTTALKEAVTSEASTWDFVLLDTPSADERLRDLALDNATDVVMPVESSRISIETIGNDIEDIRLIKHSDNAELDLLGILLCRHQRTRHSEGVAETLEQWYPGLRLKQAVHASTTIMDSYSRRMPVHHFDPRSGAATEYSAVADELLARLRASTIKNAQPIFQL